MASDDWLESAIHLIFDPRGDYIREPLPSTIDLQVIELMNQLESESSFDAIKELLGGEQVILSAFCERMAVLAVREAREDHLRSAFKGAALGSLLGDPRDFIIALSLIWKSAELIGASAESLTIETVHVAGRYGALLESFAGRTPEKRSISAMGYSTTGEGTEFSFRCNW